MKLLRVLVPSWRFFQNFGEIPALYYRIKQEKSMGEWIPYEWNHRRKFCHIFLNPQENLHLAFLTLVENVVDEINEFSLPDSQKFTDSVSYQLLLNFVGNLVKSSYARAGTSIEFQFRVSIQGQGDALISKIHPLSESIL